ncbi:hypothetical protein Taro_051994 [Colocasia esculenta]|uniref:Uncharacterized protein n=1 Tax=Colocasia esculenta TaxID=4460 RepID=A0A843XIE2_COLES|nr:hypothetical protein [Colocasia esculenta]
MAVASGALAPVTLWEHVVSEASILFTVHVVFVCVASSMTPVMVTFSVGCPRFFVSQAVSSGLVPTCECVTPCEATARSRKADSGQARYWFYGSNSCAFSPGAHDKREDWIEAQEAESFALEKMPLDDDDNRMLQKDEIERDML